MMGKTDNQMQLIILDIDSMLSQSKRQTRRLPIF